MAFDLQSLHCTVSKTVAYASDFVKAQHGATVHINQQRKSSSFSRSSKSQKHPIVLPVCLSMVEALPAKSAIFLL